MIQVTNPGSCISVRPSVTKGSKHCGAPSARHDATTGKVGLERGVTMARTVTLDVGDGVMAMYEAEPAVVVRGGVIVVQEAFGVNEHIESVCRRFAAEGFRAVAPHLFHRSGDPILDYSDIAAVMPHIEALPQAGLTADVDATLDYLASAGTEAAQTGVVGFCMGGTVAYVVAAQRAIGAAVTFYGGGVAQGRSASCR
jgi:carboxymethylenebutenolidase